VHKAVLVLGILAALVVVGSASAATPPGPAQPQVVCGGSCGNGGTGGWTGCDQKTVERSANVGVASVRHYLVVHYCKNNGWITQLSIVAHGCTSGGLVTCNTGPAYVSSGGVGSGWATVTGSAGWTVLLPPFIANSDTLTFSIPIG
jgi:hypothetical protein